LFIKVKLKEAPGAIVPEFNKLPESEVTVCGTLSLFVHVTFVPFFIFSVAGLKAKLCIFTETLDGVAGSLVVDAGVLVAGVVGTVFDGLF